MASRTLRRAALRTAQQATVVAALAPATALDAVPATFADLAAVRTYLNGANVLPNVQARLAGIEANQASILASLKAAGLMAPA